MVLPDTDLQRILCLTDSMWQNVQREFGGSKSHTFNLMSLDSNVPKDRFGNSLPHFSPVLSPGSAGVNGDVLLPPSARGWTPHPGIPGDLWVFSVWVYHFMNLH